MTVTDAESVRWAALRLEVVADETRSAAGRTAGAFPRDWRGIAAYDCQARIDQTARRVRRIAAAYDAAAEALLPYAAALADAHDVTRRAEALLAEVAEAQRREVGAGPHPSDGLRAAGERLRVEAEELERTAETRCIAALEAEAAQAPATSGWWSMQRFVQDAGSVVGGSAAGIGALLGSAWHALPGVGHRGTRSVARHELWAQGVDALQVWETPVDIWRSLHDGRYGLAAGTLAMALTPGRRLRKLERHRLLDPHLAHVEALHEAWRRDQLAGVVIYRQTAEEMGRNGVSLINEEARGGHLMERHVDKSDEFLRHRNQVGVDKAGTFLGLHRAEALVNAVLRQNAGRIHEVHGGETLRLQATFDEPTGCVMIDGVPQQAHKVLVVLRREGGEPFVYTAFPEL